MRARLHGTHRLRLAVIATLLILVNGVSAQDATQTTAQLTFEVVSIKRNADNSGAVSMGWTGNGFALVNGSVWMLVVPAYPPIASEPIGLPGWTSSEKYDVTATASLPGTPTVNDRQAMLRALLADRFNFAASRSAKRRRTISCSRATTASSDRQ